MAIKSITPYLMFDGTAEKAIKLYESVLGAKAEQVMRYGEGLGMEHCKTEADKARIMHGSLRIDGSALMVSDVPPGTDMSADRTVQISLDFDDMDDMTRKFDALAEGGTVRLALHDTFWGSRFGMLTDAFGIRWMFSAPLKKS